MIGLIVGISVLALIVFWLVVVSRPKPQARARQAASYRHQHTENPDWFPGHGGGAGGVGGV